MSGRKQGARAPSESTSIAAAPAFPGVAAFSHGSSAVCRKGTGQDIFTVPVIVLFQVLPSCPGLRHCSMTKLISSQWLFCLKQPFPKLSARGPPHIPAVSWPWLPAAIEGSPEPFLCHPAAAAGVRLGIR